MIRSLALSSAVALAAASLASAAPALQVSFPLNRNAYQTNETIDIAVVRSDAAALPAGDLTLTLSGADGSKASFVFAVPAANERTTDHLHLSGWHLRPGAYTLEVGYAGATASTNLEVFSHIRKSDFKLISWGRAADAQQKLPQGDNGFGFNLIYGHYTNDQDATYIRAGVDFMGNCVMSGGHQMDLRMDCDWSDPRVIRGGTARATRNAFEYRTRGNVWGVHFYDEPGLTWGEDPETKKAVPHMVAAQWDAYRAAFDKEPLKYSKIDANNPENVDQWTHWAKWKLSFMEAAWSEAQFGVSQVKPEFWSLTQSQYGFSALSDGYYFNIARTLPATSGHGGYHDWGPGYMHPSYTLEIARARDFDQPCYYLPTWYGNTTTDGMRLEQYLSFQTNIQGMITPPDCEPATNPLPRQGIVESNLLMSKLGPVFNQIPVNRPPVAVLYSYSHLIRKQIETKGEINYVHDDAHGRTLPHVYNAGKLLQQQFLFVIDEDIVDGTLAANHKALILTSIDYLDPEIVKGIEDFIAVGGLVLMTADCEVQIPGATKLDVTPSMPDADKVAELMKINPRTDEQNKELGTYDTTGKYFDAARPLAKAIKPHLEKAGIKPVFESSNEFICATSQAAGDIEYVFAVNAEYDYASGERLALKPADATITLNDNRPTYDAVRGGQIADAGNAQKLRFGPGQMRVFARTARPIGSIKALSPVIRADSTREQMPIALDVAATLLDDAGGVLAGSAPVQITIIDPLGTVRHDVYRATKQGTVNVSLPLASNDPKGEYRIVVKELLSNKTDEAKFSFNPSPRDGLLAGASRRAIFFEDDFDRVFAFARVCQDITIIPGKSEFNQKAAERLVKILAPWDVRAKIMSVDEASKARSLSADEAKTFIGLVGGPRTPENSNPQSAGFNVSGPVILLGNPEDNALIAFAQEMKFLPYPAAADQFPGRGRGYVAWQRDAVGIGQQSITLIAYDESGMSEAVGSMYEMVAGLEPLTPWAMAKSNTIEPAKTATLTPGLKETWRAVVSDRVVQLAANGDGVTAGTHAGDAWSIDASGKGSPANEAVKAAAAAAEPVGEAALPGRMLKLTVKSDNQTAAVYWGGMIQIIADGKTVATQQHDQDITAVVWSGSRLVVGDADGKVVAYETK